ncbi:MAG: SAM-dependent methyltransferase [Propionibacteriaceae bacterium]
MTDSGATNKDLWDRRYTATEHLFGDAPNDFLVETEPLIPRSGAVLCVGDGDGRNGVWLAARGHRVTSVDLSPVGVRKAHQLAAQTGVEVSAHVADLADWVGTEAAAGPWDAIVSIFCHLPPEVRHRVGWALSPRLAEDGVLILESYTPDQIGRGTGGPPTSGLMLTSDLVRHDWPGLDLWAVELEREVDEGEGHTGLSAVLQVVGRTAGHRPLGQSHLLRLNPK